jgi:hypothetical protein
MPRNPAARVRVHSQATLNPLIEFRNLDGGVTRLDPAPLLFPTLTGQNDSTKRAWPGRGEQDGEFLLCAEERWFLCHVDTAEIYESFGEVPPARNKNIDNRELTRLDAALWLLANDEPLPSFLSGLPLDAQPDQGEPVAGKSQSSQARRGTLDERAMIEVKKNPSLTYDQLAAILGCNASTLRNPRKYPLLAQAKAMVRAQRNTFRGASGWRDRRAGDDDE